MDFKGFDETRRRKSLSNSERFTGNDAGLVGIVRTEDEMQGALDGIEKLRVRRENISLTGNIDFNPGWHTALDLHIF